MIKNINNKMTINSQISTTEPKNKTKQNKTLKTKNKLSKQLEQEQNRKNGDNMGHQLGGRVGRMGEKVEGIRSINGR